MAYIQVTKLKVSINMTIANGTRAVNEIFKGHQRQDLIRQTEQSFDVAAEVLVVSNVESIQLHEHSDQLPKWVKCFKEFIHYRCVSLHTEQTGKFSPVISGASAGLQFLGRQPACDVNCVLSLEDSVAPPHMLYACPNLVVSAILLKEVVLFYSYFCLQFAAFCRYLTTTASLCWLTLLCFLLLLGITKTSKCTLLL